jgi:hypothetical protein
VLTVAPTLTEAAARADLRGQIARLERELADTLAATYPRIASTHRIAHGGPRLLNLAQLEQTRDTRARLQAMYADPAAFKNARIANVELGLAGCTVYAVRPRLGPVGLLTNWWRVTVSSGCP